MRQSNSLYLFVALPTSIEVMTDEVFGPVSIVLIQYGMRWRCFVVIMYYH